MPPLHVAKRVQNYLLKQKYEMTPFKKINNKRVSFIFFLFSLFIALKQRIIICLFFSHILK